MKVQTTVIPYDAYGVELVKYERKIYLWVWQIHGKLVKYNECADIGFITNFESEYVSHQGEDDSSFSYIIDKRLNVLNEDAVLISPSHKTITNALRFICNHVSKSIWLSDRFDTVEFDFDCDKYLLPINKS